MSTDNTEIWIILFDFKVKCFSSGSGHEFEVTGK